MAEVQGRLTPQAGFVVAAAPDFARFDQTTFINFYQPLLGPTALGLFYALQSQLSQQPTLNNRQAHSMLFDRLNVGVAQFVEARDRLEGVGMLQTYYTQDEVGGVFVYVLQPTMTPDEIVKDDLLSVLLLQQVGERQFNELVAQSRQYQVDTTKLHNVTHDFFEVFRLDQPAWDTEQSTLTQARETVTPQNKAIPKAPQSDFDFRFLLQQLENHGIELQSVQQQRKLILTESVMYGINETDMASLIMDAIDYQTGMLDTEMFKRSVDARYAGTLRQADDPAPQVRAADEDLKNLNEKERQLVKICRQHAPEEFLASLKRGTNSGYVSSSERNTLRRLIGQSGMPAEVINVLIHYLIVEKDNASLKANLADSIINTWSRAGVKTAADAIHQIGEFDQKRDRQKNTPRYGYRRGGRSNIKEELPEWAKHPEKVKDDKPSAEAVAEVKKMIAEFDRNYGDSKSKS